MTNPYLSFSRKLFARLLTSTSDECHSQKRTSPEGPAAGPVGAGAGKGSLSATAARQVWKDGVISLAFWSINIGLGLMVLISVLPIGLMQTWASVEHGLWYARSMEFMQTDTMEMLRWLRVIGDTIFALGVVALAWFVAGLKTGLSLQAESDITHQDYPTIQPNGNKTQAGKDLKTVLEK
jgi:nitric oxide reductase subunit B